MSGVTKAIGSTVESVAKVITNPTKAKFGDWATAAGVGSIVGPLNTVAAKLALGSGGGSGDPSAPQVQAEDAASLLAQTGGAPLLANIAMGADVKSSVASYFGASNYDDLYNSLDDKSKQLLDGVTNNLTQVKSNTDMRQQAVSKLVQDFPNIAAKAAKDRQAAGGEYDEATKGAMDLALGKVAAKYAAGGMLSSGAADAATARVGAENATDRLSYMNSREATSYKQGTDAWGAQYDEANALLGFQQKMLGAGAQNGFSAVQARLQRGFDASKANAGFANERDLADKANNRAMLGAVGQLGGTAIGYAMGGPIGGAVGSQVGSVAAAASAPRAPAPNYAGSNGYPEVA